MLRNDLKLVLIFSFRLIHWVTPGSLFMTIRWRWPKFKKLSQVQILVIWWNCVWGSCYLSMYQWIIKGTCGSTQIHFTTWHRLCQMMRDFLNCAQVSTSSVTLGHIFLSLFCHGFILSKNDAIGFNMYFGFVQNGTTVMVMIWQQEKNSASDSDNEAYMSVLSIWTMCGQRKENANL